MAIKTSAEYMESMRAQKPRVFVAGHPVEDVTTDRHFQTPLGEMREWYDWPNDPELADDFTAWSPLIDEKVSFWTQLRLGSGELLKMVEVIKKHNQRRFCSMCMGIGLSVLWAVTHDMDQALGTSYNQNLKGFFQHIQKNDLRYCLGVMDPKGDRGLPPHAQADPELYLRIKQRRADGIVVSGAKMHSSNAPVVHMFLVSPSRVLDENDKDYALSFAMPVDTPGLTLITRPAPGPLEPKSMESPLSSRKGLVECLSVFEDVFIPWERVFMCGEWDYTTNFMRYFSPYVRLAKCACTSARIDLITGAAALMAQYNGVAKAGHIREKLTDMMIASEIAWGCVQGAVAKAVEHPSGIAIPNGSMANAGLYHARRKLVEFVGVLQEIGGGVVTTMPLEADYDNPETRPYIEKFLQGARGVDVQDRLKLLYLIQDLTASRFSGYFIASAICAGGTPQTNRVEVFRNYDLREKINNIKAICNINQ